MAALPGDRQVSEFVDVERNVHRHKPGDIVRPFRHQYRPRRLYRRDRRLRPAYLQVEEGRVVRGNGRGDAALGIPGV